jgi:MFS family permease
MRTWLAGVAGAFSAFVVVAVVEGIGHAIYAPAAMPDMGDAEAVAAFIRAMPLGAFLFVLAAYLLATITGGLIAAVIARRHGMRLAIIVGALILTASAANFIALPHPAWFVVATVAGVPAAAWLTGRAVSQRAPAGPPHTAGA